jgi:hypothetical protein
MFENCRLKKIFWSKMNEVKWEWRKLQNEKPQNLYYAPVVFTMIYQIIVGLDSSVGIATH